jgi:hypothetical protein
MKNKNKAIETNLNKKKVQKLISERIISIYRTYNLVLF